MGLAAGVSAWATDSLYQHVGAESYRIDQEPTPPNIDATTFVNSGDFIITNVINFSRYGLYASPGLPYEPWNMLNFTNQGSMVGLFGFRFNRTTDSGSSPMQNFVNENGSRIYGTGLIFDELPGVGQFRTTSQLLFQNTYVLVSASNVVNRGLIETDNQSLIQIQGSKVDLAHSAIQIRPIGNVYEDLLGGSCLYGGTTWAGPFGIGGVFIPDQGIDDYYWGVETNDFPTPLYFQTNGLQSLAQTPPHNVTQLVPPYVTWIGNQLVLTNPVTFVYTNQVDPTNWIVQAVFVQNADTNITASVQFGPSLILTNPWTTPVIEFVASEPDYVNGGERLNYLYFMDYSTSWTNLDYLETNTYSSPNLPTMKPAGYAVSRTVPCEYLAGRPANAAATEELFFNRGYSNIIVTNFSAAYAWVATNVSIELPAGASISNSSARVEIRADELNLEGARIRGEGLVSIKANHLSASSNAVVDVDHAIYTLGSTNGNLNVQDVTKDLTRRMGGTVYSWTGVYTNFANVLSTNVGPDPTDPTLIVTNISTNLVNIGFHLWMVDNQMQTRFPQKVHELTTHSTNVTLADRINVYDSLNVDAQRLTVTGTLNINDPLHDWRGTNFPNLNQLTNEGVISVVNSGYFGSDRTQPYQTFVNRGLIEGLSHNIRTEQFENSGRIVAQRISVGTTGLIPVGGPITLQTTSGKLEGGEFVALRDIQFTAGDLKFRNYTNTTGLALRLNVTNVLTDAGGDANNQWSVKNGIYLQRCPASGDLLGTTVTDYAPFREVNSTWAARDRGVSAAGFSNNVAVGHLILDGAPGTTHRYSGTGTANGLYVDFLDLRGPALVNLGNALRISSNLIIYFAYSNLPAEELDGMFKDAGAPGGRLRWVKEFAGPNSGMDLLLPDGRTIRVNRALRNSPTIDSDGDGTPNAFDLDPFTPTITGMTVSQPPALRAATISVGAPARSVYQIEYTSELAAPVWTSLGTFTNEALTAKSMTVLDTNLPPSTLQRFYRLRELGP